MIFPWPFCSTSSMPRPLFATIVAQETEEGITTVHERELNSHFYYKELHRLCFPHICALHSCPNRILFQPQILLPQARQSSSRSHTTGTHVHRGLAATSSSVKNALHGYCAHSPRWRATIRPTPGVAFYYLCFTNEVALPFSGVCMYVSSIKAFASKKKECIRSSMWSHTTNEILFWVIPAMLLTSLSYGSSTCHIVPELFNLFPSWYLAIPASFPLCIFS